jgi:hypothetical protein
MAREWEESGRKSDVERIACGLRFLTDVKLFRGEHLDRGFVRCVKNAAAAFCSNPNTEANSPECLHEAIFFCMFGFVAKRTKNAGLPTNLLFTCMEAVRLCVQSQEEELWRELLRIKESRAAV